MDIDLAKSLEQLEMKKRIINDEADLTKECQAIVELDHRIALLLKEIKNLRNSIDEQSAFICDNYDKLEPHSKALKRASCVFDLTSQLTVLNRLCRRIDSNQVFKTLLPADNPNHAPGTTVRRASLVRDNGDANENDDLANQILGNIIEKFEAIYNPLEGVFSQRKDLPYALYASKVRKFKQIVNTPTTNGEQH